MTRDVNDRPTNVACWNHPEYVAFWAGTMEDLFRSYDLDGVQWGAERMGPLMNVISPWNNDPPTCFCEHCRARGRAAGIDAERARQGYKALHAYVQGQMAGAARPPEGMFGGFLRLLIRYPEILGWEYQYRLGREAICEAMYRRVKQIKPSAEVGWHVDHQPSSWDLVYRAEMSYEEMAPHTDFIKIIALSQRAVARGSATGTCRASRRRSSARSPLETSLELYYDLFGYDKRVEPSLAELGQARLHARLRASRRRGAASPAPNGKTKIYTGIGFDVPGSPRDDPETIYQATRQGLRGRRSRHRRLARVRGDEGRAPARRRPGRSRGVTGRCTRARQVSVRPMPILYRERMR